MDSQEINLKVNIVNCAVYASVTERLQCADLLQQMENFANNYLINYLSVRVC